jgi:hypothetical protein
MALQQAVNGKNGLAQKTKVIVLGGDGFCGWPTSLYLSDQGHDVIIVDNLSWRNIDMELGCDSLMPIQPMEVCLFLVSLYKWMRRAYRNASDTLSLMFFNQPSALL